MGAFLLIVIIVGIIGYFTCSKEARVMRDVDRMINQFISNPSYETAYALMDLMLDFGESVMYNIPQKIRIELKKFKR